MPTPTNALSWCAVGRPTTSSVWLEPTVLELDALKPLLETGNVVRVLRRGATDLASMPLSLAADPGRSGPAATLLRRTVFVASPPVRPYFAVCALEAWRRVPVKQLARWSDIPFRALKRRLAVVGLTAAGVAAWNLALHAAWLLDVADLPAIRVVQCMRLGRHAALAAVLGGRGVRFAAGKVQPGAFATTLDRYLEVLRGAFRV